MRNYSITLWSEHYFIGFSLISLHSFICLCCRLCVPLRLIPTPTCRLNAIVILYVPLAHFNVKEAESSAHAPLTAT